MEEGTKNANLHPYLCPKAEDIQYEKMVKREIQVPYAPRAEAHFDLGNQLQINFTLGPQPPPWPTPLHS